MANVLSDEKRNQVEALGRLGWTLRRIQRETGVRRETASEYLKAAGIAIRGRGGAKPATSGEVITDPGGSKPATSGEVITDPVGSKPASGPGASTDPKPATASSCEPYRELIERWLRDGRHAMSMWQELVEKHGFEPRYATVQRFVRGLRETAPPEARVVIATKPGEEAQV